MRKLTEKSTKDAAAVKVLTMITLIYLPATVVSVCQSAHQLPIRVLIFLQNFFSTDFVGQVQEAGGSTKVIVLANAWLFAAISIPLTLTTIVVWWLWVRLQAYYEVADRRRSIWRTILNYCPHRHRSTEEDIHVRSVVMIDLS